MLLSPVDPKARAADGWRCAAPASQNHGSANDEVDLSPLFSGSKFDDPCANTIALRQPSSRMAYAE